MKVLFLGYGHMGSALGDAWRASGLVDELLVVDPAFAQGAQPGRHPSVEALCAAGDDADIDLVVLAVKPALAVKVLGTLPAAWGATTALLSVAAGVTLATLAAAAPAGMALVRAMPNTPALLGAGCTGLYAGPEVDEDLRAGLDALLATVGTVHWLDAEAQLDMVTAISGSGPAYYHLFSEALTDAGVVLGLPAALARELAAQTTWGAATLQHQPGADFAALRRAVTSPNGTTAAAIAVFEQDEALRRLVQRAAEAARQRALELSQA